MHAGLRQFGCSCDHFIKHCQVRQEATLLHPICLVKSTSARQLRPGWGAIRSIDRESCQQVSTPEKRVVHATLLRLLEHVVARRLRDLTADL